MFSTTTANTTKMVTNTWNAQEPEEEKEKDSQEGNVCKKI